MAEAGEVLAARLEAALGVGGAQARAVAARLVVALDDAARRDPGLGPVGSAVLDGLIDRLRAADPSGLEDRVADLPVADLVLAEACADGHGAAIRRFEELYFGSIGPALRRMGLGADEIDEVTQVVRERLFVAAAGERARVTTVIGQGDLRALVRVMAIRIALNERRRDRRVVHDDGPLLDVLAPSADPEVLAIAEAGRVALAAAFGEALGALEKQDRAVLRMHLLHALSLDEIARAYRVHRATAARWLARIREQLEAGTRRALRRSLGPQATELDSVIRLAQSRIELSFDRLLATSIAAGVPTDE